MKSHIGYWGILMLVVLSACRNGSVTLLPEATGAAYSMVVVADSSVWNGVAGRTLCTVLSADIPGLPQAEPYFDVTYVAPPRFGRLFKSSRNIIVLTVDSRIPEARSVFSRDFWAESQGVMNIKANNEEQLAGFIEKKRAQILSLFEGTEQQRQVVRLQDRYNRSVTDSLVSHLGVQVRLPLDMDRMKKGRNFFWASNDKAEGRMDFVAYSVPYTSVDQLTLEQIIALRDSVMQVNIPGGPEGAYMTTQRLLEPVEKLLNVEGKYCKEIRGLWEMKGDIMGGPFVSHVRIDEANRRIVVTEVFVYAPSKSKRNLLRRLEASLYTVKLPDITTLPELKVTPERIDSSAIDR